MSKTYKVKKVIVKTEYKVLAALLILLAGGLVLLPKYEKNSGIKPESFLLNIMSKERYVSTDQIVDKIIKQDPNLLLIDVRNKGDFNKFSLPNAINIPLNKVLSSDSEPYLDQDEFDVVLYSNDNFYADQAWQLCNRMGYQHIYVLKGGLNEWFNTIINPKIPKVTDSELAFKQYDFRKAAAMYFGVGNNASTTTKVKPKKVIKLTKKKKKVAEGGC
jgi:rhodanese-related sulfurtransferase